MLSAPKIVVGLDQVGKAVPKGTRAPGTRHLNHVKLWNHIGSFICIYISSKSQLLLTQDLKRVEGCFYILRDASNALECVLSEWRGIFLEERTHPCMLMEW